MRTAVDLWEQGEKVLVFAFYIQTCRALRFHISREIERRLSDGRMYLVDGAFSVADILVKSCLDWASIYKIELPKASQAYSHRLSERPAFQKAMKQNFTPKAMAALAGDPTS